MLYQGQALGFCKISTLQVVFSQKTLTKQQATIVLYAKFCIYSLNPFIERRISKTHRQIPILSFILRMGKKSENGIYRVGIFKKIPLSSSTSSPPP